jgi:hypothetical protein
MNVFIKFLGWSWLLAILLPACTNGSDTGSTAGSAGNGVSGMQYALERLPDDEAGRIVKESIALSGGWTPWVDKETLSYIKITEYFDSLGNPVRSVRQLHQYQLRPQFKARISWENEEKEIVIIYDGQQAKKFIDGRESLEQSDINQAWNSSFGSHYVMCMPFKLTDPGTVLTYEGRDTLAGEQPVESIRVTYQEGAGSAAGMHTWWYYFDPQTRGLVANFLDHGDGYSFTEYVEFVTVDGIRVSKQRKSYATNADRQLKYVSTVYTNEEIQFDVSLEEGVFTFPPSS